MVNLREWEEAEERGERDAQAAICDRKAQQSGE